MDASAVVLAAGAGSRFGGDKVWAPLGGRPVLGHSLSSLARTPGIGELVVVVRAGEEGRAAELGRELSLPLRVVVGGARRADSARAGVAAAAGEHVLVHDGARPLVTPELAARVLAAARRHGAAVPVVPVSDTVRYVGGEFLRPGWIDREGLAAVQTPQGFRRDLLLEAYAEATKRGLELPDDAAAVLLLGHPVAAVSGDPRNLKLTWPEDLAFAERLL
ncbi:MAG: 2-C-methyl-D-erythritol 4-phosphate cytidylyltransferase [Candidatus Bipolaricaulota bacterium]|nr:2-C-methyl-D-erythritol 4-phosphate cytidylyltransferase [Candidatus Bipolaricaulota bacterium]